jgi:hypothetical protein
VGEEGEKENKGERKVSAVDRGGRGEKEDKSERKDKSVYASFSCVMRRKRGGDM